MIRRWEADIWQRRRLTLEEWDRSVSDMLGQPREPRMDRLGDLRRARRHPSGSEPGHAPPRNDLE
jgi:hypothetical protein